MHTGFKQAASTEAKNLLFQNKGVLHSKAKQIPPIGSLQLTFREGPLSARRVR